MRTNTTMEIEPMVYKIGNDGTMLSFTGAAEALVDLDNCKNVLEMERALDGLKEYYDVTLAELPMLVDYEAENKNKLHDTFWVLNNVKKFLSGIKVLR